jgi:alpha-1,3-mannosyl-glycoprotein beta-1,2-N-acetylglucosaminyltransferase
MRANKRLLFTLGIVGVWSLVTYLVIINRNEVQPDSKSKFHEKVRSLETEIKKETEVRRDLMTRYANLIRILSEKAVAETSSLPNVAPLEEENEINTNENTEIPWNNKINFNGKYINNDVNKPVIPVVVFACNRVTVSRSLDLLIKYRPNRDQFPIIVSQVCVLNLNLITHKTSCITMSAN